MKTFILSIISCLLLISCDSRKVSRQDGVVYTCSMDPQVMSDKPGNCPICGMTLTPVKKSAIENSDDLALSDQQIQLGNIRVDTLSESHIGRDMEFTGVLNLNASRTTSISARVMGRIEKLYVKTTGDYVSKGMPLCNK